MAKEKTLFACTACGYETSRWVGRCPGCGAWNTMVESAPIVTGAPAKAPKQRPGTGASAMLLREIPEDVAVRSSTGISELDRVLGGGIVEGALMLIGGDPGICKCSLLLQVCANLCKAGKRVLYVSGEESAKQLKLRANRLGITSETLYVLAENALDNVEEKLGRAGFPVRQTEGYETANWVLLDFGDVIVHVFDKENRLLYDLERIWRDGVQIPVEEL